LDLDRDGNGFEGDIYYIFWTEFYSGRMMRMQKHDTLPYLNTIVVDFMSMSVNSFTAFIVISVNMQTK